MRILVIGAHHGVGSEVMKLLLTQHPQVTAFAGDVLDGGVVADAVLGHDAIVSTLGPRAGSPPPTSARGAPRTSSPP